MDTAMNNMSYPLGHRQLNELMPSRQVPPLRHGLDDGLDDGSIVSQSFTFCSHLSPLNPGGQTHWMAPLTK